MVARVTLVIHNLTQAVAYVVEIFSFSGNDLPSIRCLQEFLSSKFQLKDLGKLKYFLGIKVARSTKVGRVFHKARSVGDKYAVPGRHQQRIPVRACNDGCRDSKQFAVLHNALKFEALRLLSVILSSEYSAPLHEALRSMKVDFYTQAKRKG
ncbi:hypothetical protein RHSIM_Rhsim01G0220500 [Rhododendron simsii]|uniref:Reverse transcriptase Ty1/copia-type domain-containing protein n=1 Tax=Rhododendron simsii TaxID=118357 RepID=A0A834HRI9_RHOSS|nr:hypothetical protein RHSIM_Rhsim01G0220500 [Rhododendron simsii]